MEGDTLPKSDHVDTGNSLTSFDNVWPCHMRVLGQGSIKSSALTHLKTVEYEIIHTDRLESFARTISVIPTSSSLC
jgi:hypothetical protein